MVWTESTYENKHIEYSWMYKIHHILSQSTHRYTSDFVDTGLMVFKNEQTNHIPLKSIQLKWLENSCFWYFLHRYWYTHKCKISKACLRAVIYNNISVLILFDTFCFIMMKNIGTHKVINNALLRAFSSHSGFIELIAL